MEKDKAEATTLKELILRLNQNAKPWKRGKCRWDYGTVRDEVLGYYLYHGFC
jgi:hypothetical protein